MPERHEVVISGISGRFPDCSSLESFKKNLFSGTNLNKKESLRWNPKYVDSDNLLITGKIPKWNYFDGTFFGITSKLMRASDPLLGKCLETSFEAMVDAGVNPFAKKGHNIGVITTSAISDSEILRILDDHYLDGLGMVGHSRTMLSNRISYCFNFNGPSYNCDSSWASASQGIEIAAGMVGRGEVEGMIVTACNLISFYAQDLEYRGMNMMSPDGKSLSFDEHANGFTRSEGVVSIYIQRAAGARRNYCSVLKAEYNPLSDKSSSFVGVDNRVSDFIKEFYDGCNVSNDDISYVEAHGIGIHETDAVELNALAETLATSTDKPLLVGSLSGNVGNCECTSGLVSLAKVIIAMECGVIPPTINYQTPNSKVPALVDGRVQVITKPTPMTGNLVAINCFSVTGAVSHVLVKRNPKSEFVHPTDGLPRLVILQARHEAGTQELFDKLSAMPVNEEFVSLVNNVFAVPIPAYLWRAYAILPTSDSAFKSDSQPYDSTPRPVWYVFSGMGSQWTGMGRHLLKIPVFASAIDRCDRVLRPNGLDIKDILTTDNPRTFENILNCFVGIAAVQIGLVDILSLLGVTPDGMVGHSVGELGCGYADGCLTAEQMILAAYARGKASLDNDNISGMMAAVGLGNSDIKDRLPPSIDVACHNSSTSCTLSGPTPDVMAYVDQLKKEGVFARAVSAGGIAYHSRHVKPIGSKLLQYLKKVIPEPKPRSSRWVSSSVPQSQWDTSDSQLCSAEYHTNNLLSPVLFEEACKHIPDNAIMIEIAPRGLLQAILRRSVAPECISMSLTSNTADSNISHLLGSVGKLFLNNVDVDVNALYPPVTYPVSRGCPSLMSMVTWDHDTMLYQEFAAKIRSLNFKGSVETVIDISPDNTDHHLWSQCTVHEEVVVPVTQFLEYTWDFVLRTQRYALDLSVVSIEDCFFSNTESLRAIGKEILISCTPVSLKFAVNAGNEIYTNENIATGNLQRITEANFAQVSLPEDQTNMEEISDKELYGVFARFGLHVGLPLRAIMGVMIGAKEYYITVKWTGSLYVFMDALLQVLTFLQIDEHQSLLTLTSIKKMAIDISYFKQLVPGSLVHVLYDTRCDRLVCGGAEVIGVTFRQTSQGQTAAVSWAQLQLQPLTDNLPLPDFLRSCVQLVSNTGLSSWRPAPLPLQVLLIREDKGKNSIFAKYFSSILDSKLLVPVNVSEVSFEEAKQLIARHIRDTYLLVGNLNRVTSLQDSVINFQNVYIIANMNENGPTHLNSVFRSIIVYKHDGLKMALMKTGEKVHQAKIFEIKSSDWLKGLRQLMEGGDNITPVIVVSLQSPGEVLPQLATERYVDRVRSFFILDKDAPRFTATCQLYRDQLCLGIPVNILSGGRWSSLNQIGLDVSCIDTLNIQSSNVELDVKFIGLNTSHFTLDLKETDIEGDMKYVDYSGTLSGHRVMGVGQLDSLTYNMTPETTLQWRVPDDWTLEEAATVPVVYSLAYYCVSLVTHAARVLPSYTVLVQAGLSPLGQAVIRVVLETGAAVITTVEDDDQALQLTRIFPQLNSKQVIVQSRQDLKASVRKLTVGKGVQVVISCTRGRMLQSSLEVMGVDCRFIHLGKVIPEDREAIGMFAFVKSTSFYGISLDSIASLPQEWKESLRNSLQSGLECGTVRPLQKNIHPQINLKVAIKNLTSTMAERRTVISLKINNNSRKNIKKHNEKLEIAVILCSKKTQLWMDLVEWMNTSRYNKVVVLADDGEEDQDDSGYFRRLNQLVHRHNSDIVVTSSGRLDSAKGAANLVNELVRLGNIAAIFTVNLDEDNERLVNLETASRQVAPPVRQWVSFLGRGEGVSQSRASAGLPVCCVRTLGPLHSPGRLLPDLSAVLDNNIHQSATFLLVRETASSTESQEYHDRDTLSQLSLERISSFADSLTERPVFTEEVTRSPGHRQVCHDLLPLFVVPGPCGDLTSLLPRLIHPAYLSSMPATVTSVKAQAMLLLEDLLKIQTKGMFNILCDMWSSAVTLEVGCLLESKGHQVQLFMLEGGPAMAQERLRELCERYDADLATSLVADVCNLPQEITKKLSQLQGWEDKLSVGLRSGQVPDTEKVKVSRSLTSVYQQLTALQLFQGPSQLFRGDITVISHQKLTSIDVDSLSQMCKERPELKVTNDKTYRDLLNNYLTVTIINDNMFHDWAL